MTARTWKAVPTANTFASIDPALRADLNPNFPGGAPWAGAGGHAAMLDAWCSLVPSQDDGLLIAGPGGGHGDGASNAQARIDLMEESPAWALLSAPSGALPGSAITYSDGQEATGLYSDGRIRAMHNYNNLLHIPGTRRVFVASIAAPYYNPLATAPKSYYLDMDTGAQSLASDASSLIAAGGPSEGGACYDPTRNCVWHVRNASGLGNKIVKTDIATGISTEHGVRDSWTGNYGRFVYIPGRDLVMNICGVNASRYCFWNPATETWSRSVTPPTGAMSAGLEWGGYAGAAWVDSLGGVAVWNNNAGYETEISLLSPPATNPLTNPWVWSVIPAAPSNSVTPSARPGGTGGTANVFGKFGYLPALKGFYLKVTAAAPLYFYAVE